MDRAEHSLSNCGIVFEGGGMRAIFEAGVIDWLLKQKIYVPNIYAVSAGAGHAASYASRQIGRAYAASTDYAGEPRFAGVEHFRKNGDYFNFDFIDHEIPEKLLPLDNEAFKEAGTVFYTVVTNCVTGEAEYLLVRDLFQDIEDIHASCALPFLSNMVPMHENVYLDGGISDSIPVRKALQDGCEKVVCVLTQPRDYRKRRSPILTPALRLKYRRYPKLIEAMEKRSSVYNETLDFIRQKESEGSVFVIAPLGKIDIGRMEMDRDKLRKTYNEGYYTAEGFGAKLQSFLGIS
ncbi:MAG: patatin family protein [Eubacteriales bacterium]|nr:patatin family protein [Eubacteriales bacterium]